MRRGRRVFARVAGVLGGGCFRVNAFFPKSSSIDDDREGSGAVLEDDRGPWWANHPELIEMRRRTVAEFDRELDQRQPGPARTRYEHAVRGGAAALVGRDRRRTQGAKAAAAPPVR
jgi:hypothetical protein